MLEEVIRRRIRQEGPISFKEFMSMSLYHPEYGYYTRQVTQIGIKGDYFTAPHLHPVFGALVGRQIEEMWYLMDEPQDFYIVEFGAGKGYLAADMLGFLKDTSFYDSLTYLIIELNPHVQRQQHHLLSPFGSKINWVSSAKDISPLRGCILSNELIDAFPVHLIQMEGSSLKEVYVDKTFSEVLLDCSVEIRTYVSEFDIQLFDGYRTEVNLVLKDWLRDAAGMLVQGFIFSIDYGYPAWQYYSVERSSGTLMCYCGHQASSDTYLKVGQDITAHVNFSALKRWGEEVGLNTVGYCQQGTFLVSLGIDEMMASMLEKEQYLCEAAQIKRLILPQGMGESHKVLIQSKGMAGYPVLRGFSLRNQMEALE
ncbi:MAG: SAM-dependent methyltransferase [Nitrospirae bacterium]|nr:SAM-dependent methyltransferase [Nitrospirota bacterium]